MPRNIHAAVGEAAAALEEHMQKEEQILFPLMRAGGHPMIHAPVGRKSFDAKKLTENAEALIGAILRARPSAANGKYLKSVYLSTTMGPSFRIDPAPLEKASA